jgi:hypothetical protein
MALSPAPTTIHTNGMVVATGLGGQSVGRVQNLQGGLLNSAAAKTASSIAAQAGHAKAAGVTMKGGGQPIHVPEVAEGRSIPGVSFAANHAALHGGLNQLNADKTYDGLIGTTPYKIGGRRIPDNRYRQDEPVYSAGRKHKRKTKRKHGNNKRTSHRRIRKHHSRTRRSSHRRKR